jgi:putative membrane protein
MSTFMSLLAFANFTLLAAAAFAQGQPPGHGMGPGMMGWGGGMGWPWPIMMLIFWVAVIVGVVFLVRWLTSSANRGRGGASEESALDILKKRYAKGEISKDEYEKIKKDIS